MQNKLTNQQEITQWFNSTYKRFGLAYLRPVEAYQLFLELLQPQSGGKILDVACGPGQLLIAANPHQLKLYGVDISEVAVQLCKRKLPSATVNCANAEALPFADKSFDYITCLGSLERFIDREQALKEQWRVAKPGASFCFLVRNANNFKWKFIKQTLGLQNMTGHQDALSLTQWRSLFAAIGFEEIKVLPDHWPKLKWKHYFLSPLGVKPAYKKVPIAQTSIEHANEFIFLLRKKNIG